MILPLLTHLQARSNSPSAFLVCRVRNLLDSEASGDALSSCSSTSHSRRAVLHLVQGTPDPDDGDADRTVDRVHGRWSFWKEPKKKLRRTLVYNAGSIVKNMYSIARQVADGLRRVDTVRSVHREDSFQKNQRF